MVEDSQKTPTPEATKAAAGLGVILGTILAAAQSLSKVAGELKPLNETIARHRDMSTRQLDILNGSVDKLVGAFGRYDRTCQAMAQSFDEAAKAHNEAAEERARHNASLDALTSEVRRVVKLLENCVEVIEAVPTLIERQVSDALARGGTGSSSGLH